MAIVDAVMLLVWEFEEPDINRPAEGSEDALKSTDDGCGLLPASSLSILTSPLAITKPQGHFAQIVFGNMLFNTLTSINTTHWGIMMGSQCYDLKRAGRWPFARAHFESAGFNSRNESDIIETIKLGRTHFTHSELLQIGKNPCMPV